MSRGYRWVPGAVSVVIVCYNRLDMTAMCFKKLQDHAQHVHEIVFVDNNSTDGTARWLQHTRDHAPGGPGVGKTGQVSYPTSSIPMQVASLTENVGWGRGANIGANLAEGEYLLQLNNDTEVSEGWLAPLVGEMADPEVGAAAGRLVDPDGTLQHAGVRLFYDGDILTAENIKEEQPPSDVIVQAGAAQLIRTDAWHSVGGISNHFRNGYEDVDFCLRLHREGWRLRYNPASTVMHHQHASGPERWTHTQDNIRALNERWRRAD